MDKKTRKLLISVQRNEITEHFIYKRLAEGCKDQKNAEILHTISEQEKQHAAFWQEKTNLKVKPDHWRITYTVFLARLLGLSFVLKQMEKREGTGSKLYNELSSIIPETKIFAEEESIHEQQLLTMLDEERLQYVGSIVLGLNDALVELTGALAGFTLTLGTTRTISLAGLVTGISAALSMAASDYLSTKAEGNKKAKKSAAYTGIAYFFTVIFLILPFLLLSSRFFALSLTLLLAVLIIFFFNYYISVAKELEFKSRFFEMCFISLGVAAFSFFIGYILNSILGVNA
ncbi:MAG TPA: VIT1/CCC1 family protein [Paludibacteraceae bacterium]|nr:VIT1/CCC1 family protein [Paludibacteraceae bacterium]